ncbi:MAG: hypothetical protein H8K07_13870 [Nitrospira sp.]|jgi:hypothetical protein|nr:hypothetical protein [Nitrospira sp.]MDI3467052.1 hypothetical protein [Nitrospira sp.]
MNIPRMPFPVAERRLGARPVVFGMQAWVLILLGLSFARYDAAIAKMVSLAEAEVSFEAPPGFSALNAEEMRLIYQTNQPPKYAVGNEARTTTIGYDLAEAAIRLDQLKEAKPALESMFERSRSRVVWKQREIITLQGQPWISFELTFHGSDGEGTDIEFHDILLMTSRHGRLLRISFNSTQEEFLTVENALRKTIQSIRFTRK